MVLGTKEWRNELVHAKFEQMYYWYNRHGTGKGNKIMYNSIVCTCSLCYKPTTQNSSWAHHNPSPIVWHIILHWFWAFRKYMLVPDVYTQSHLCWDDWSKFDIHQHGYIKQIQLLSTYL